MAKRTPLKSAPKAATKIALKTISRKPNVVAEVVVEPPSLTQHASGLWWSVGLLAALGFGLMMVSEILLPFVVGLVLAYMLNPMVSTLTRWGLPRPLAASLPVLLAVGGLASVLFFGLPSLLDQMNSFAARLPVYLATLERIVMPERFGFRGLFDLNFDFRSVLRQLGLLSSKGAALTVQALQQTLSGAVWLINILLLIIMTPIVAFYLLMDWPSVTKGVMVQLPKRWHAEVKTIAHGIDEKLSAYLRGTFLVCLTMGFFYALALNMVGPVATMMRGEPVAMMELAWAIGIATGFLAFLPVIGSSLGALMMISVALVQYQLQIWEPYALIAGIFVIGQTLEGYVMTPMLVGNRVGLHPLWIIFALLAGGALAGIAGMLAALPVAVVVSVILPRVLAAWRVRVG